MRIILICLALLCLVSCKKEGLPQGGSVTRAKPKRFIEVEPYIEYPHTAYMYKDGRRIEGRIEWRED